jgi:hypothetical protein
VRGKTYIDIAEATRVERDQRHKRTSYRPMVADALVVS